MSNLKKIRTPAGICIGTHIAINEKRGIHIEQHGKKDDLLPEQIVEFITGRPVERIIFADVKRVENMI